MDDAGMVREVEHRFGWTARGHQGSNRHMSPEVHVTRTLDAWNRRDVAAYTSSFAEDAVLHDPFFPEPTKGRDALAELAHGLWSSFSDVRWELNGPVIADGNRAAFVVAIQMTHDGPLPMPDGSVIDATGEKIAFDSAIFWTFDDDGLVVEERGHFDATAIALQLGLVG
jgi:steroid delta-isomerase-like uncharacterized protein